MSRITFNTSAKCDKAGRQQNQDNHLVCPDLSLINQSTDNLINNDSEITLSEEGALFVVADGMGGMNAGEKASELVVSCIKERFKTLPTSTFTDNDSIVRFISDSIIYADEKIKDYAKRNRDAEGLGSTIVLLWLYKGKAFCGWCGDSRIYRYNPNNKLIRLSHDHSYVQSLVDEGKISEEEAFEHPDSNIVTRNLGDSGEKAKPETKVYDVFERDVFLLCSDGLCGLLQDKEIEDILSIHCSSTKDALHALWKAGEEAKWNDNATIELVSIESGGKIAKGIAQGYPIIANPQKGNKTTKDDTRKRSISAENTVWYKRPIIIALIVSLIAIIAIVYFMFFNNKDPKHNTNTEFNIEVPSSHLQNNQQEEQVQQQQNTQQQGQPQRQQNQQGQQQGQPQRQQNQQGQHQGQPQQQQNQQGQHQGQPQQQQNQQGQHQGQPQQQQNQQGQQQHQQQSQQNQQLQIPNLPSEAYLQQYNQTKKDYEQIKDLWRTVKETQYIDNQGEYQRMLSFAKNVNHLANTDNADYQKLSQQQRREIQNWKSLATEIENNISNYVGRRQQRQQQHYQQNQQQDGMYSF